MMTIATNTRRLARQTNDDDSAEEEATLAGHLSQTFCVKCSFCGEPTCSPAAVGQAADYNDRFDVAARLVAKGWGMMTEAGRSRKLRPAARPVLETKPLF